MLGAEAQGICLQVWVGLPDPRQASLTEATSCKHNLKPYALKCLGQIGSAGRGEGKFNTLRVQRPK